MVNYETQEASFLGLGLGVVPTSVLARAGNVTQKIIIKSEDQNYGLYHRSVYDMVYIIVPMVHRGCVGVLNSKLDSTRTYVPYFGLVSYGMVP